MNAYLEAWNEKKQIIVDPDLEGVAMFNLAAGIEKKRVKKPDAS